MIFPVFRLNSLIPSKLIYSSCFLWLIAISYPVLGQTSKQEYSADAKTYTKALKRITDTMILDAIGPCAVARYYTYVNLAAYEINYQLSTPQSFANLNGLLSEYPDFSKLRTEQAIDVNFASIYALFALGEELLPSGYLLNGDKNNLILEAEKKFKINKATIEASKNYAEDVIEEILKYAGEDGYKETSGYLGYTPSEQDGKWVPTPPGYMQAYEPNWDRLRPFIMDSVDQFKPVPPVPYSNKNSEPFFDLANVVYKVTQNLTPEQESIARFWDCNPFFLVEKGHIRFGVKKISPGGHWMGITGIASIQKKLSFAETVRWHTVVSITMADAFISCWNEKYKSNRIRPETYINQHIDPNWKPILQTPPFPEYTSGHSVVSTSVAIVLTQLAGDSFAFIDSVEMEFGLPSRGFQSFNQAAKEAAISRLYGGIHYLDAIENGVIQGSQIGEYIIEKLNLN